MRGRRVAVIGGGVSGMTAAHELAKRGFTVKLFERRSRLVGGKARSTQSKAHGLPAEHGFRYFPGFYRHLTDTMKDIPFRGLGKTVYDNLVPSELNLIASTLRDPVPALPKFPSSREEFQTAFRLAPGLLDVGLTQDDVTFYFGKLWKVLSSSRERRLAEFENQSWWEFSEASSRSQAYRDYLVIGATRNTVAARAEEANALTIAQISLQLWANLLWHLERPGDRVLNGPTQEVWLDPWRRHLGALGVEIAMNQRLHAIEVNNGRISSVVFNVTNGDNDESGSELTAGQQSELKAMRGRRYASIFDKHAPLVDEAKDDPVRLAALSEAARRELAAVAADADKEFWGKWPQKESITSDEFDYFVFALPIEQMAKYITNDLADFDPRLRRMLQLKQDLSWMAGIQFYLNADVNICRGHVNYVGSPWALTSILQSQLWADEFKPEETHEGSGVKSILSVCISNWTSPGLNKKEAGDCTPREIALEVWNQLKQGLNRPGRAEVLTDDLLNVAPGRSADSDDSWYSLDDNLSERLDLANDFPISQRWRRQFDEWIQRNEVGEPDLLVNAEPLLVNKKSTWQYRPEAGTAIPNMLLASDYVRTNTNLACMEGANEAAKRAVNEILQRAAAKDKPCDIWELEDPAVFKPLQWYDGHRFQKGARWKNIGGSHVNAIVQMGKTGLDVARSLWSRAKRTDESS